MAAAHRAMFLHGPRELRAGTLPTPAEPGPGQALIRIGSVGVCGSDLHMYQDGRIGALTISEPFVMGHEFGGQVVAVGSAARDGCDRPLAVGSRVAVEPAQHCGLCENCRTGHPNLCNDLTFLGSFPDHGALQEYLLVPAHCCFPVPETVDPATVAMLEPLGVALHATKLAKPQLGDSALIVGAGTIGLLVLDCLRAAGVGPIFVSDHVPERLAIAADRGATPLDAADDPIGRLRQATDGRGVDIGIEAAWCDALALRQVAEGARLGGRLVIIGIPAVDELSLPASQVRRKGLTIRLCRRMQHTYPRAIALVAAGHLDPGSLVTHRFPLSATDQAYALANDYRDGVVKAVVDIS